MSLDSYHPCAICRYPVQAHALSSRCSGFTPDPNFLAALDAVRAEARREAIDECADRIAGKFTSVTNDQYRFGLRLADAMVRELLYPITHVIGCDGCAKVARHPGEGYVCGRHPLHTRPDTSAVAVDQTATGQCSRTRHGDACHKLSGDHYQHHNLNTGRKWVTDAE